MPKVIEAIQNFIKARRPTHNAPELLDRLSPFMEMQINQAADRGEQVDGKRGTYTDGEFTWWNIRVPKNANGEPEFHDYEMRWPLELHVEGLGWTGWDWCASIHGSAMRCCWQWLWRRCTWWRSRRNGGCAGGWGHSGYPGKAKSPAAKAGLFADVDAAFY